MQGADPGRESPRAVTVERVTFVCLEKEGDRSIQGIVGAPLFALTIQK